MERHPEPGREVVGEEKPEPGGDREHGLRLERSHLPGQAGRPERDVARHVDWPEGVEPVPDGLRNAVVERPVGHPRKPNGISHPGRGEAVNEEPVRRVRLEEAEQDQAPPDRFLDGHLTQHEQARGLTRAGAGHAFPRADQAATISVSVSSNVFVTRQPG